MCTGRKAYVLRQSFNKETDDHFDQERPKVLKRLC
jgi:hypothetical protein